MGKLCIWYIEIKYSKIGFRRFLFCLFILRTQVFKVQLTWSKYFILFILRTQTFKKYMCTCKVGSVL